MKRLVPGWAVLLGAAILFVAAMIWVRGHPPKPEDPLEDARQTVIEKLGMDLAPMADPGGGMLVNSVVAGSAADQLGFRKGDRVLAVGDQSVWHIVSFTQKLDAYLSRQLPVPVLVNSDGNYHSIVVGRRMAGAGPGQGSGGAP